MPNSIQLSVVNSQCGSLEKCCKINSIPLFRDFMRGKMNLITIHGNPISWKRPGINTKTGHLYDQQANEKDKYRWQISSQITEKPFTGPLELDIIFYIPIPKSTSKAKYNQMISGKMHHFSKPDIDNLQKFVLDCMTGIVYQDDCQIFNIRAAKCWSDHPKTSICVRPANCSDEPRITDKPEYIWETLHDSD